eukprot:scaffold356562_cov48-Prasinocladus_malaysianus.AAC.1
MGGMSSQSNHRNRRLRKQARRAGALRCQTLTHEDLTRILLFLPWGLGLRKSLFKGEVSGSKLLPLLVLVPLCAELAAR